MRAISLYINLAFSFMVSAFISSVVLYTSRLPRFIFHLLFHGALHIVGLWPVILDCQSIGVPEFSLVGERSHSFSFPPLLSITGAACGFSLWIYSVESGESPCVPDWFWFGWACSRRLSWLASVQAEGRVIDSNRSVLSGSRNTCECCYWSSSVLFPLFPFSAVCAPSLHPVLLTSAIIGIGGVGYRKPSKCKRWKGFYLHELWAPFMTTCAASAGSHVKTGSDRGRLIVLGLRVWPIKIDTSNHGWFLSSLRPTRELQWPSF